MALEDEHHVRSNEINHALREQPEAMRSYLTDEERRLFELFRNAAKLSALDVTNIEKPLHTVPSDMSLRVQLFGYWYSATTRKQKNSEEKLLAHVLWFIENQPAAVGPIGHRCSTSAMFFSPRLFAIARQAWLEQVDKHPGNAMVIGNAGNFIVWKDFEIGSRLLEEAASLDRSAGWLQTLTIHCNGKISELPSLYQNAMREKVIDVGMRSLKTEGDVGAPCLPAEYVAEAALTLGRYDLVKYCALVLYEFNPPATVPLAKFYGSLLALREGNKRPALELISQEHSEETREESLFRLASALYDLGERESIVQMILSLKGETKESSKKRWVEQIGNNKPPDFLDS